MTAPENDGIYALAMTYGDWLEQAAARDRDLLLACD
jgi:hypothetical protein